MKSNHKKITFQKTIFTILLLTISILNMSSIFADTYNTDSPNLRVIVEEITPEPVEPGQDVTVKVRLINDGGETADDVSLKLDIEYPFFIKTESNNFEDKKSLCVGCSIDNAYYLTVDANAKSGLYPLNLEFYRDGITIRPSETVNIQIVGKPDVILETKVIETNIASGDKFTINFDIKNIGTGIARNIKLTPTSENILMLGSNINFITEVNPDSTISTKLEFIIKESLKPDTYKFPINVEYTDELGNTYKDTFNIGVNVLNRADINFQSLKITPTIPTLIDTIHMEGIIENTGTGDAKKVIVELITSKGTIYKTFVGQLKYNDDSPFYFDIKPETVGIQTATLRVSYSDDFGTHVDETKITQEIKKPTNNIITVAIIIGIIIMISIYFLNKKKSKTKK